MNNGRRTLQQGDTVVWPAVGRYKFQSLTPCLTYYRKFTENNVGKATILALFFWIKQQYALLSNNSFEKHFGFKLTHREIFIIIFLVAKPVKTLHLWQEMAI